VHRLVIAYIIVAPIIIKITKKVAGSENHCLLLRKKCVTLVLFPLIFVVLLWLIYALNIILNGNFEPVFPPIISFIKIFVAEKVAKSPAELCQVVVMQLLVITGMRLSSADLTAAIDTASEECQQRCDDNVDQRNDLI